MSLVSLASDATHPRLNPVPPALKRLTGKGFRAGARMAATLLLLLGCASPTRAADYEGTFVRHVIEVWDPGYLEDGLAPIVVSNSAASVQLPLRNPLLGHTHTRMTEATLLIATPDLTPAAPSWSGATGGGSEYPFVVFPAPQSVSATLITTYSTSLGPEYYLSGIGAVGNYGPGSFGMEVSYEPVLFDPVQVRHNAQNGMTLTVGGRVETQGQIAQTAAWSAEEKVIFSTGFTLRVYSDEAIGEFSTWQCTVKSYYRFVEVPGNDLTVTSPTPAAGAYLREGTSQTFSATLNYRLRSHPTGELVLRVLDAQGEEIAHATPVPVTESTSIASATLSIPSLPILSGAEKVTLSAGLLAGSILQEEVRLEYLVPPLQDSLTVIGVTPSPGTPLLGGERVNFIVDADYHLQTDPEGELQLDLLDANGQIINASTPLAVSRTPTPQRARLFLFYTPGAVESVSLRLRLVGGGQVLREAAGLSPYPVGLLTSNLRGRSVTSVVGEAELIKSDGTVVPLVGGEHIEPGDRIITGPGATARISRDNGDDIILVQELTDVTMRELLEQGGDLRTRLWLRAGQVESEVNPIPVGPRSSFEVETPVVICGVRGTKFSTRHVLAAGPAPAKTIVSVTESTVEVTPQNRTLASFLLTAGQSAEITADGATSPHGPEVVNLNPSTGTAGVTDVTITGANFHPVPARNVVRFGDTAATVLSASATQLTARVPPGIPAGATSLVVTTDGLRSGAAAFTVTNAIAGTPATGDVTGTWTLALSPWLVTGRATVPAGGTLVIEPGVVVRFAGTGIGLDVLGTLIAAGTSNAPIQFTSAAGAVAPGSWDGIRFLDESNDADTRLAHCIIERAGGGATPGAVRATRAAPRLDSCILRDNLGPGLFADAADPWVENCYFSGNTGAALAIVNGAYPSLLGNHARGNGRNAVSVAAGTLARSGVWTHGGIPWLLEGMLVVGPGEALTLTAGATVQAANEDTHLVVEGTLIALGTASEPVRFTSDEPEGFQFTGQWGQLAFTRPEDDDSVLEHCQIEFGGAFGITGLSLARASPAIRNCVITDCGGGGITLASSGARITDCSIIRCTGLAVTMDSQSAAELRGTLGVDNYLNAIYVSAGNTPPLATWGRNLIPWLVSGRLVVPANGLLRIESGATVQFGSTTSGMNVFGDLRAVGTPDLPVRFTTAQITPAPGQWANINFAGRHALGNHLSLVEHCVFEYGGAGPSTQVSLDGSPRVRYCTFQHGLHDGLYLFRTTSAIEGCRFLQNGRNGLGAAAVLSNPIDARDCVFVGNSAGAVQNNSTQVVNAPGGFWGDATGPLDASNGDGSGRLNPGGTGGAVSENVNWTGFRAADPATEIVPLDLSLAMDPSGALVLDWPFAATGAVLETSPLLEGGTWLPVELQPLVADDLLRTFVPSPSPPTGFYRLTRP